MAEGGDWICKSYSPVTFSGYYLAPCSPWHGSGIDRMLGALEASKLNE